jgi:hypothetical protein
VTAALPPSLYRFVQLEFAWPLGPEDGRYVLRRHAGDEAHHVLVIRTWAPPAPRGGRRRRTREVPSEPEAAARGICRATLVDADRVDDELAGRWLRSAGSRELDQAIRLLNFAIRAHRAAAADPYVHEVEARHALLARAGYGAGFEVADGTWTTARELPLTSREEGSRRSRRTAALRPQERLAALLSGRDAVLACEDLALRARLDLDNDRPREAALQAHLALEAAIIELQAFGAQRDLRERVAELDSHRDALAAAANEALQGGPSEETVATVQAGLDRLEAALRARASSASY